jgi:hypothetical protein
MKRNNYLRKLFLGSTFFSLVLCASAQEGGDAGSGQSGSMDELVITPIRLPVLSEVGGSMFMTTDYRMANVVVNESKTVAAIPVKFNIFNNAIMVRKDGQDMQLEIFQEVSYESEETKGAKKRVVFRAGYPEIDRNSQRTIYQVLSAGPKVHLLKFYSQKVEDVNTLGDYSRREIVTSAEYYLYVPGGEIKKIKPAKKDILAALPSLSGRIDEIASANNLKLKSESDITLLVEELNKP